MGVCGSHPSTSSTLHTSELHPPSSRTSTHASNSPRLSSPAAISPSSPPGHHPHTRTSSVQFPHGHTGSGHFPSTTRKERAAAEAAQNAQITKLMHESAKFHKSQGGTSLHFTRLDLKNLTDIYLQLKGESDEITKELFQQQIRVMNAMSRKPGEDEAEGMGHIHEEIQDRTAVASSGPLKGVSLIDIDLIFDAFDYDRSGSVSFKEMISGFSFICRGSEVEKFRFLFRIFDSDGNGELSRSEFIDMLKHVSASVLKMEQHTGTKTGISQMSPLQAYVAMNGGRTKRAPSFLGMPPPPITYQQKTNNEEKEQQDDGEEEEAEEEEEEEEDEDEQEEETDAKDKSATIQPRTDNTSPKPAQRVTTLPSTGPKRSSFKRAPSALQSLTEEKPHTDHIDTVQMANSDEDEVLELVASAFQAADTNQDGKVSLEEFERWVVGDAMAQKFMESLRSSCTRICGINVSNSPITKGHRKRLSQDMDYRKDTYYDEECEAPMGEVDINAIDVTEM